MGASLMNTDEDKIAKTLLPYVKSLNEIYSRVYPSSKIRTWQSGYQYNRKWNGARQVVNKTFNMIMIAWMFLIVCE